MPELHDFTRWRWGRDMSMYPDKSKQGHEGTYLGLATPILEDGDFIKVKRSGYLAFCRITVKDEGYRNPPDSFEGDYVYLCAVAEGEEEPDVEDLMKLWNKHLASQGLMNKAWASIKGKFGKGTPNG